MVRSRILDRGASLRIPGFSWKSSPGIDTPIEDQKWSGCFVERTRGSDRGSLIGVVNFCRHSLIL